jgi:hypothetical protein
MLQAYCACERAEGTEFDYPGPVWARCQAALKDPARMVVEGEPTPASCVCDAEVLAATVRLQDGTWMCEPVERTSGQTSRVPGGPPGLHCN